MCHCFVLRRITVNQRRRRSLLPSCSLQLQRRRILRHSALGALLRTALELRGNLKGHSNLGVRIGHEVCDDLVGQLHQVHLGGCSRNFR